MAQNCRAPVRVLISLPERAAVWHAPSRAAERRPCVMHGDAGEGGQDPIASMACFPRRGWTMSRVYLPVRAHLGDGFADPSPDGGLDESRDVFLS